MPVDRLRWIAFSHLEADECGAVDEFLEAAPTRTGRSRGARGHAVVAGPAESARRVRLDDGEVLDIGGATLARSVLEVATPHVPHNWESHLFFEQETATLFLGDLLTQLGDGPAITSDDLIEQAVAAEDLFHQTSLGPAVPETYRRLADLSPPATRDHARLVLRRRLLLRCCGRWPTSTKSATAALPHICPQAPFPRTTLPVGVSS